MNENLQQTFNIYTHVIDAPDDEALLLRPRMLALLKHELRGFTNMTIALERHNREIRKENKLQQTMIDSWVIYEEKTNDNVRELRGAVNAALKNDTEWWVT